METSPNIKFIAIALALQQAVPWPRYYLQSSGVNVIVGRENGFWSIDPAIDLGPMAATLLSLKNQ